MATKALLTAEPMTEEQRAELTHLAENAMARALAVVHPSQIEAKRVQMHGDDFVSAVVDRVRELSTCDKFQEEEVVSERGYVSGYRQARSVAEQVQTLREIFPAIGSANESLASREVPKGAEGWFAIPRWEVVAPSYGEAVERVLAELAKRWGGRLANYREGKLGGRYLHPAEATATAFAGLKNEQKNYSTLVVAAQFGILHRGRSVRRSREVMCTDEFGLGAFAAGIMLLSHPERLEHYDDLWIDCAGDEYSPEGNGSYESAPYFSFYGGWLKFDMGWIDDASDGYGSVSGFHSQ